MNPFVRVAAVFVLGACGGKLALDEPLDAGGAVAPPRPAPEPPVRPFAKSCAPAAMTTEDYGSIDVSQLGCTCEANADCGAGASCVWFPALDSPRCAATTDPCSIMHCGGTCIVFESDPASPVCYRR